MRMLTALLVLASCVSAGEPRIVGSVDSGDSTIRVKQNNPPWVTLSVEDAPDGAIQTWLGPIGEGQVGIRLDGGVGVATGIPGTYRFRVIVQAPLDGPDTIDIYESTVIVEGGGPAPDPPKPEDFPSKLTAAVKAVPESHGALKRVANAYLLVADQVKNGLFTKPEQVVKFTDVTTGLIPEYAEIKQRIVDPHVASLNLQSAADFEPVWRQISNAIKAGLMDVPPPSPPIPVTSLHVLILEETENRNLLPSSQVLIFTSTKIRKWLGDNGAKWRIWDKDVDATREDKVWQDALKIERGDLPWVIVSDGAKGYSGPLPKTVDEMIELLEKYK